jgi:hypothetical protein
VGILQVPVIAVFTKYDQFKREIKMKMEDARRGSETNLEDEGDSIFHEHYLTRLGGAPPFVRLESEYSVIKKTRTVLISIGMHKHGQRCTDLIEITADALSGNVVAVMLLAVQKDNLEPNMKQAIRWYVLVCRGTRMRCIVTL